MVRLISSSTGVILVWGLFMKEFQMKHRNVDSGRAEVKLIARSKTYEKRYYNTS